MKAALMPMALLPTLEGHRTDDTTRACQSVFLISGLIGILCESDFGSVPHLIAFVTQLQLGARTEIRGNVVCGGEAISAYRSV